MSKRYAVKQLDEDTLYLQVKPLLLYLFVMLSTGLILFFFCVSLYIPSSIKLTCNKYQYKTPSITNCQIVKHNCWGFFKKKIYISANYYELIIEEDYIEEYSKPDYKVILLADKEKIKIANYSRFDRKSNSEWQNNSKHIDEFMRNINFDSLTVGKNNISIIYTFIYLIFILIFINLIVWIVWNNTSCIIFKSINILSIKRYNLFNGQKQEISLDKIEKAIIEKSNGIEDYTSRIAFKLKNGKIIPLTRWLSSLGGEDEIVKKINYFMK